MKIGLYVLNIFCFVLMSCGDDQSATDVVAIENTDQKLTITTKAIENFDYTDYALSKDSEDAIANWEKYQELAIQISYLRKTDLSFFNGDKDLLKKFIGELRITTPKQFLTSPIISRTVILETTLLKLNENLTIDNIDVSVKLLNIKQVLIAFSNLNYQMNKKLERDFYDKIQPE